MKKPLPRCTVHAATTINATNPAAVTGVSSPAARPSPAAVSAPAAAIACSLPGFIPMLSNQAAVPGMKPGKLHAMDAAGAETDRKEHTSELHSRGHSLCRLL